jgi:glycosidase
VDIGVVGFRIDAAKHMWPGDIEATIGKVGSLPEGIQHNSKSNIQIKNQKIPLLHTEK